jgi:hypothetical protein
VDEKGHGFEIRAVIENILEERRENCNTDVEDIVE